MVNDWVAAAPEVRSLHTPHGEQEEALGSRFRGNDEQGRQVDVTDHAECGRY
jgi:hypothetical protein